jgi:hypothetical protein
VLLAVNQQEALALQDHASDINLSIDMERDTLTVVEPQANAVQVRAFQ